MKKSAPDSITCCRTLATICITIQIFKTTQAAANEPVLPDTNLSVAIGSNGEILITWEKPLIQHEAGSAPDEYPAENYQLSYTYYNAWNDSVTNIITTTAQERQALIKNAFLGSTYHLELNCQIANTFVRCKNHTFLAYPSCPEKWSRHLTQCYYLSKEAKTWPGTREQCLALMDNSVTKTNVQLVQPSSNEEMMEMVKTQLENQNEAVLWMGDEACNQIQPESISRYNCCMSLKTSPGDADQRLSAFNPFDSTTEEFASCTQDQNLPFFCRKEVQVITSSPENITFSSYPNNSVRVSWSESPRGWNLNWRTVALLDKKDKKLNTLIIPNEDRNVVLPPLTPGDIYSVLIWPHKDGGSLLSYAVKATFALISSRNAAENNGGVLYIRPSILEASLLWNGSIYVSWAEAKSRKDGEVEINADQYQLIYGPLTSNVTDYVRVNVAQTFYNINFIKKKAPYSFYLRSLPMKISQSGDNFTLYENSTSTGNKTWQEAEHICQKKKGHLLSMTRKKKNVTSSILVEGNTYWIGANSCNANGNLTWSDGSPWIQNNSQFANDSKSNNTHCCVESNVKAGLSFWTFNNCEIKHPFVCKFILRDLGILRNLTVSKVSSSIAELQWKSPNHLWPDVSYKVYVCPNQNGSNETAQRTSKDELCSLYNTVKTSPVMVSGLSRTTTYQFKVLSVIEGMNVTINATVQATTGALLDIVSNVSCDGKVSLEWPRESDVQNEESIVYVIQAMGDEANRPNITASVTGNRTTLQGLTLGGNYNCTMYVIDNKTGTLLDTAQFTIHNSPSCHRGEYRYNLSCYWIGEQRVNWDDGETSCVTQKGDIALVNTKDETLFLRGLADQMETPFWINGKTSSLIKSEASRQLEVTPKSDDAILERQKREANDSSPRCRVITPDRTTTNENGIHVEQCGQIYPVMCERQNKIIVDALSNVIIEHIDATTVIVKWTTNSWKPSSYEISTESSEQTTPTSITSTTTSGSTIGTSSAASSSLNSTSSTSSSSVHNIDSTASISVTSTSSSTLGNGNGSSGKRRKKRETVGTTIKDNTATISNLQPNTNYKLTIAPVVSSPGIAPVKGESSSVTFTTNALNEMPKSEAQYMNEQVTNENSTQAVHKEQLSTFRIISCATLIALVAISATIFCFCRMFMHRDGLSQICFQLSLLVAHILILLDVTARDQLDCTAVAVSVHYFFMTCFLFFALECFCHLKVMTKMIPLKILNKSWQLFLIGWGVPLLVIIISVATVRDHYVLKESKIHCWLNLDEDAMYASVIPIGIFAAASLVFLCLSICARPDENYEVDEESYIRYEPMQDIRWMLLFILLLLVSHWSLGMVAAHATDGSLFIAFVVLNIILGIAILMLRCIGDDQIRHRIRSCSQGAAIGPGEPDIGKYLSSHEYGGKGGTMGSDGCLIIKKTYIFRP